MLKYFNLVLDETSDKTWPPPGYGLTDKAKTETTSTMGANQPTQSGSSEDGEQNGGSGGVKKYVVPVGCAVAGIAAVAIIFGVFKHFTKGEY